MTPDGLAQESFGTGTPSLAFVHGFTQTRESWRPIASRFASSRRVALIDLPGHGESIATVSDLDQAGRLLVQTCNDDIVVGYSMGARVALHGALLQGNGIRGLVLIGAHPGIVSRDERTERRRADEEIASRIEQIGVEAFIDEWLAQPMFESVRQLDRADRLTNTAHGLAEALRHLGTGTQEVLDERLGDITCPVLLIVGQNDTKFIHLARRMMAYLTRARMVTIAGAGHACHLEKPEATSEVLDEWLDSLRDQ